MLFLFTLAREICNKFLTKMLFLLLNSFALLYYVFKFFIWLCLK